MSMIRSSHSVPKFNDDPGNFLRDNPLNASSFRVS